MPSSHTSASPTRKHWFITTAIALAAMVITGIGVYYTVDSNKVAHADSERQQREAEEQLLNAAAKIEFDQPPGAIPRCAELTGRAQELPDQVLWVAHRAFKNGEYWLKRPSHTSNGWATGRWTIGGGADSTDDDYEIIVLYVERRTSDFLESLAGDPHGTALPPATRSPGKWKVRRNSDPKSPPCSEV